jgi:hypothetical protein
MFFDTPDTLTKFCCILGQPISSSTTPARVKLMIGSFNGLKMGAT